MSSNAKGRKQDHLDVRSRKRIPRCARLLWRVRVSLLSMGTLLLTLLQAIPQGSFVSLHHPAANSGNFRPAFRHLRKLGVFRVHSIQAPQPEQDIDIYHDLSALMLCRRSDACILHLARPLALLVRRARGHTRLLSELNHFW